MAIGLDLGVEQVPSGVEAPPALGFRAGSAALAEALPADIASAGRVTDADAEESAGLVQGLVAVGANSSAELEVEPQEHLDARGLYPSHRLGCRTVAIAFAP